MASKILVDNAIVGEFLTDNEGNYMGVLWEDDSSSVRNGKIQDIVESNYISSANKVPTASVNISSAQIS